MTGKRVNDLVDIRRDIEPFDVVALFSGVGSGKNSFIEGYEDWENSYPGLVENGRVLFITSRRAKVDETITRDKIKQEETGVRDFIQYINEETASKSWSLRKSIVCTNAHIVNLIKRFNKEDLKTYFWKDFDYVVIDEFHSVMADATFSNENALLLFWLRFMLSQKKKPKLILMSGTPEPAIKIVEEFKQDESLSVNILDLRDSAIYLKPSRFFMIKSTSVIPKIVQCHEKGKKIVYFTNKTAAVNKTLKDLEKYSRGKENIRDELLGSIAVFVSKEKINEDIRVKYPNIDQNNKELIDSLAANETIPDKINLLITNSKAKEGINIKSPVNTLIVESHNLYDIIQMCGRIRKIEEVEEVYLVIDSSPFSIKDYYALAKDFEFEYECKVANEFLLNTVKESKTGIADYISYVESRNAYIKYNPFEEKFCQNVCYAEGVRNLLVGNKRYENYFLKNQEDCEFAKYFCKNAKLRPAELQLEEKKKDFLTKIYDYKGINLDGLEIGPEEKEKLHNEINALAMRFYKITYKQFGRLLKEFGYQVKEITHKKGDKHRWRILRIIED